MSLLDAGDLLCRSELTTSPLWIQTAPYARLLDQSFFADLGLRSHPTLAKCLQVGIASVTGTPEGEGIMLLQIPAE